MYRKQREIATFALLAFFLIYGVERVYAGLDEPRILIANWTIEISLGIALSAAALLIPIVMTRLGKLYTFPPLVGVALIAVNAISSYYRTLEVYLWNIIFYLMGFNIWYPTIDLINSVYIRNPYLTLFANPVDALMIPDLSYTYLLISGVLLALPTFILFGIVAWREKSGKAIGFILGLIVIFIGGVLVGTDALAYKFFELIGISVLGIGIFGLIDKYLLKKPES